MWALSQENLARPPNAGRPAGRHRRQARRARGAAPRPVATDPGRRRHDELPPRLRESIARVEAATAPNAFHAADDRAGVQRPGRARRRGERSSASSPSRALQPTGSPTGSPATALAQHLYGRRARPRPDHQDERRAAAVGIRPGRAPTASCTSPTSTGPRSRAASCAHCVASSETPPRPLAARREDERGLKPARRRGRTARPRPSSTAQLP